MATEPPAETSPRLDTHPKRPERTSHIRLFASGVAGNADALHIDGVQLVRQSKGGQLLTAGAKRVGLEHVGAGPNVGLMHLGDKVRLQQVQRIERLVHEHAVRVEHRAHRPVADEHPPIDFFKEGTHHNSKYRIPNGKTEYETDRTVGLALQMRRERRVARIFDPGEAGL